MTTILTQEFDAQAWVSEWMKAIKNDRSIATSEGTMLGWFENAIMAGHDHAMNSNRSQQFYDRCFKQIGMPVPDNKEDAEAYEIWILHVLQIGMCYSKQLEIDQANRAAELKCDEFGMSKDARCPKCGGKLQIVRPGKYQCGVCE